MSDSRFFRSPFARCRASSVSRASRIISRSSVSVEGGAEAVIVGDKSSLNPSAR